jgi:hypothetical protein
MNLPLVAASRPQQAQLHSTILAPELYLLPPQLSIYPLKQFDQLELYVDVNTMPTGASFVDITLITFQAFLNGNTIAPPPTALEVGEADQAGFFDVIYLQQFLELDPTTPADFPFQDNIRITAAAATIVTASGATYTLGKRVSFPIEEDYIGFLVQTDGTSNTGVMSMRAILGAE